MKVNDRLLMNVPSRLEKLKHVADRVHQEVEIIDSQLENIRNWIGEEARNAGRHPAETRKSYGECQKDLLSAEEVLKALFQDVHFLRESQYHQAHELHRRYASLIIQLKKFVFQIVS